MSNLQMLADILITRILCQSGPPRAGYAAHHLAEHTGNACLHARLTLAQRVQPLLHPVTVQFSLAQVLLNLLPNHRLILSILRVIAEHLNEMRFKRIRILYIPDKLSAALICHKQSLSFRKLLERSIALLFASHVSPGTPIVILAM